MASISIQGRIDGDIWSDVKGNKTTTEGLQLLAQHWKATSGDALSDIAPTPAAAVAVLRHSHELLTQMLSNGVFAMPSTPTCIQVDAQTKLQADTTTGPQAIEQDSPHSQADDW
ncbi:MAG: hypothetical protein AAGB19_13750 [Cyanobacteria bacterium P01_F01_bin.3]